ncbi:hypothetical protein RhiirC2_787192 [Rhizophagus irregularis]|uniref:Protein kinase domain-containing protein n=1 Tax=Rhizophagus irregularis TaxID=588596 RepID=A0A2N1MSR5_9GLOM|nr:hypothetical protein RhiirC2_787192 [Rhizophagus irregularis]
MSIGAPHHITLTLKFINKIKLNHKVYGITQDPETKYYMIIVNNKCGVYNNARISIYFQQNFENWTSGNNDIDKLIQDTQLSFHNKDVKEALEWIPYDRLYNIKYIGENKSGKVYRANWFDHYHYNHYDNRKNVFVKLKSLSTPKILILEFINKIKLNYRLYGITQNPVTNNYMIVFDDICEICTIYSQQSFKNWTSGNTDIDKLIQDTQLAFHKDVKEALEWIPYDSLCNIKYIEENKSGKVYRANWIDGWTRKDYSMFVNLKNLNNPNNLTLEFANKIKINHGFYGIT